MNVKTKRTGIQLNLADFNKSVFNDTLRTASAVTVEKCRLTEQMVHTVDEYSRAEGSPKILLKIKEHCGFSWKRRCLH